MADTEDDNATLREGEAIASVSAVHVLDALSHSISTDGTTAMLVLEVADENEEGGKRKFALTFPVPAIAVMRDLLGDLLRHAKNRGLDGGNFVVHAPLVPPQNAWAIGSDPRYPKSTTLIFNVEAVDVYAIALRNIDAYRLGGSLQRDVGPRLTPAERQEAQLLPQLLTPNKGLIRP